MLRTDVVGDERERGSGGLIDRREATAWVVFVAAALVLLALIGRDLRPLPLFPDQAGHPDAPAVYVTSLMSLEVRLRVPEGAERIRVPVWTDASRSPLEIELSRIGAGKARPGARTTATVTHSGLASLDVPSGAATEALRLRFGSRGDSRQTSPRVIWSALPASEAIEVLYADRPLAEVDVLPHTGPLLLIEYRWPTRTLITLWMLPLLALPLAVRDPRRWLVLIVLLALAASATSALLWQRDYTRRAVHRDADEYAKSAVQLAHYATHPQDRAPVREWLREHPHATTLAVSTVLALPVALGAPVEPAFMLLCAAAGLLTLLVLRRTLQRDLGIEEAISWGVVVAFACHPIVLRSFARPVTDGPGLLLVVLTLAVLARRTRRGGWRGDALLAALVLAHPLVRPQGLGYWPFIALAALAADAHRSGVRPGLAPTLRTGLVLFGPPLAVLMLLALVFGWAHNLELMLAKASRFRVNATPAIFVSSLFGCVQLLPFLWWPARKRLREPPVALFAAWGVYAVSLLVVVRAPFWLRHFEPALPAAYALAAVGLCAFSGRRRRLGMVLLGVMAAAGVGVTLWQVTHMTALPAALEGFVRSP